MKKVLYSVLSFIAFIFLIPLFTVIGIVFVPYRQFIKIHLKHKHGKKFKGLFGGRESVWTVGNMNTMTSAINALCFIELDQPTYDPTSTPQTVLSNLTKKFGGNMLKRKHMAPKIFYKKQYECGYSFWLDEDPGPIEKYIRPLEFDLTDDDFITQATLTKALTKICNKKFPDEHTRNWEFLVGNKAIDAGHKVKLPVLFRISHLLGDGVTLLRLLLEVMADEPKPYEDEWVFWNKKQTSMCSKIKEKLASMMNGIILILMFPYYLFSDLLRPSDGNVLHQEEFTGEKVLYMIHETDADIPLLDTLKKIRRQYPGTRFNDVLLTMTTKGIAKVLNARSQMVPSMLAMMIERITPEGKQLELHNKFSFLYRKVPIEESLKPNSSDVVQNFSVLLEKIKAPVPYREARARDIIFQRCTSIFPRNILELISTNFKATFAISVLPGLRTQVVLGGYELKDLLFFAPNVGRLGIGISVITYGDKLHLAIQADKSALSDETEAKMILNEILNTIRSLKEAFKL